MRKAATASIIAVLITAQSGLSQTRTSSVPYSTEDRGGQVVETVGDSFVITAGYARVQPTLSTTPTGTAIFALRQNGVLVAEAGVPGSPVMLSGRTYAEVNGPINTGVAIVNPNSSQVTLTFNFTDQNGNDFGHGSFNLDANTQFILFSGSAGQSTTGTLRFFAQTGQALILNVR